MKRTAPRRKRRTPRAYVDEGLRWAYREMNPEDEWAAVLNFSPAMTRDHWMLEQVHHLFTNPRRDLWSNFITLSAESHAWAHAHLDESRVLSLLVKLRKDELDLAEMNLCRGITREGHTLRDWVESLDFRGPKAWMLRYRDETLCRLKGLEEELGAV